MNRLSEALCQRRGYVEHVCMNDLRDSGHGSIIHDLIVSRVAIEVKAGSFWAAIRVMNDLAAPLAVGVTTDSPETGERARDEGKD